jgi:anthranilate synthase component 2
MLILIDNYDSFTFNLVQFLGDLGAETQVYRNDKISVDDVMASGAQAIVLSPGPCAPDDAGICLDLVAAAAEAKKPLFGVCLGHQSIGQAFGGNVVRAEQVMHGKTSKIIHTGAGIFAGIPDKFDATRYHSLTVARDSLPNSLKVTAETADGVIMGLEHAELPIHGVQFHPESIASQHGHTLLRNFLELSGAMKG